jgi:hypothetical protein
MEFKNLYKSKKIRYAVGAIVALGFLLFIFEAGVFLGYHKAEYTSNLGDNYIKTFEGGVASTSSLWMRPPRKDLPGGHGAVGKVIKVEPTSVVVASSNNVEEIINIDSGTIIRQFNDEASTTNISVGDTIVVVGYPNNTGEIQAKLIRILDNE